MLAAKHVTEVSCPSAACQRNVLENFLLSDSRDFPVNPTDRWPWWNSTPSYVLIPSQLTPGHETCDHFHIDMADPKVSLCGDYI